jgi:hypothetical protein
MGKKSQAVRRMQTLKPVGIDPGNNDIKGSTSEHFDHFPHALSPVYDFNPIEARDNPHIFLVNGEPVVIGRQAERQTVGKLTGNARYTRNYVGTLAAIMLFKLLPESHDSLFLNMSFPPRDRDYRPDIIEAVKGKWDVVCMGARKKFTVIEAGAFSEPSAAFRHATLAFDGVHTQGAHQLRKDLTIGVDLGGFTLDTQIFEDGKPDHNSAQSFTLGIMDLYDDLERQLRRDFKAQMRGVNDYPRHMLQEALRTNQYPRRGTDPLNCKKQVDQSFTWLLNQIDTVVRQYYGSWNDYNAILLMNGGSAAIEKRVRESVNHTSIHVAEMERENMRYCTSFGLLKIARALINNGGI